MPERVSISFRHLNSFLYTKDLIGGIKMKKKTFTIMISLIVALLSISVIAIMIFPDFFSYSKEEIGPIFPEEESEISSAQESVSSVPPTNDQKQESSNLQGDSEAAGNGWGSGDVYDGSAPIIRKMGEEIRIDALPHRKQGEKPPMSTEVFALWVGEMGFTVTSAELFDSIEETGLNYDEFIYEFEGYDDTYKPLVVELTVKNYNAYSTFENGVFLSERFMLSSKEEFSPEKFRSQHNGEWRVGSGMPLVYVSPHSDGARDYFYYTLGEGETLNFTLCYYVDTAAMPLDELYLEILTNSSDHRFGFTLDQLKGVE